MSRIATKACDNVFYLARYNASSMNDRLSSREGAAEELGMDKSRLAKIELALANPYPDEIMMMAKVYHAPELANYFCREMCPLGGDVPKVDIEDLDRITVRAVAAFRKLEDTKNILIDIASDGKVSQEEAEKMTAVLSDLQDMEAVAQSLRLWVKKNLKEG